MVPSLMTKRSSVCSHEPLAPFLTPRDYYRYLRSFYPSSKISLSLLRHPFVCAFQPSAALIRLLFPNRIEFHEPIFQFPSGAVFVDVGFYSKQANFPLLSELCQLVLLWRLVGQIEAADRLIAWLFPFLNHPTFWTSEENYDPQEFAFSVSLLYDLLDLRQNAEEHWQRGVKLGPVDPFFLTLKETKFSKAILSNLNSSAVFFDQNLGVWVNEVAGFTLSGNGTSLGTVQGKDVSICAFGPQLYLLADMKFFGIQGVHQAESVDVLHLSGWTRFFADPNAWLHVHFSFKAFEIELNVQWLGLTSDKKNFFVFYVKADTAHIGDEVFLSKSLQRYRGNGKQVSFNGKDFIIECSKAQVIELIPLVGKDYFWGADFLLAISLNPFDSSESFFFRGFSV